jgi:hypothetical protein
MLSASEEIKAQRGVVEQRSFFWGGGGIQIIKKNSSQERGLTRFVFVPRCLTCSLAGVSF